MRIVQLFLISIVLLGCETVDVPSSEEIADAHPSLPRPIMNHRPNWKLIENEGKTYVATEYDEFIDFMIYQEDIGRYINQTMDIVCYYREDLKEEICVEINKD